MKVGKIETGITLKKRNKGSYDFLIGMDVGHSRLLEPEKNEKISKIQLGLYQRAKYMKIKVATGKEGKGLRVIRVK